VLVEIWSDVVCPWCYIGKRRFEAALDGFEHKDEVEVRWRSFELDPDAPSHRSGDTAEHLAAKYGMTVADARERLKSMDKLAAAEGLHYDLAHTEGGNTFDAHRLIHLGYDKSPETGAALKESLFAAYFTDLRPVGEPETLVDVGVAAGLDKDEVAELLASNRFAGDVREDETEAARLGCTGVPFFVIDRAFAVPGAQDRETLLLALRRAWTSAHPLETVGTDGARSCSEGSCEI
jgi:predicted DsbA family dithiol-disulfide isomerase